MGNYRQPPEQTQAAAGKSKLTLDPFTLARKLTGQIILVQRKRGPCDRSQLIKIFSDDS